jgi:aminopeptidase N
MKIILVFLVLCFPNSIRPQNYFYQQKKFDVLHYNLDLNLYNCFNNPYPHSFNGIEKINFKAEDKLTFLSLNASNGSIEIDSVSGDARSFSHFADTLTLFLNRVYNPDENFSCIIYYQHKDVEDDAFFVKDGMVFTNAAPEGSRYWFPCFDHPSDKATFELTSNTPKNVLLGSNGLLIDSMNVNDTIYYHWRSDYPMATYLMVISAKKNYNLDLFYCTDPLNKNDSVEARFYWKEGENLTNLRHIEKIIPQMLEYYSELFGEYPFKKIGFATMNDLFFYGGMENQTLISLCTDCWREDLISHEFSHHWFGDLITCESWADIWLNESFAEYCESLWLEHTNGAKAYSVKIQEEASRYFMNDPGFPIVNPKWKIQTPPINQLYNGAIIYSKGACVLHMLRYVLGDSLFFGAIKNYITDKNYKYGNISTESFIKLFNEYCKKDYSWFFEDWLYLPAHPVYKNIYSITREDDKWITVITVNQEQNNSGFFRMILPIRIEYSDDTFDNFKVMNDKNGEKFTFISEKKPVKLYFDQNDNIILKLSTTNRID